MVAKKNTILNFGNSGTLARLLIGILSSTPDIQKYIMKIQSSGTSILITDHNVKNLFDITDRSYVLGEQTVIAEGTSRELLKSSKAIEHYFGSQFN